jgi:polynucleotide 5'-kinase involved in rRNA processing
LLVIEASLVLHVTPWKENAPGKATPARGIAASCDEMAQSLEAKIVVLGSQGVGKTSLVQFVLVLTFEGRGC